MVFTPPKQKNHILLPHDQGKVHTWSKQRLHLVKGDKVSTKQKTWLQSEPKRNSFAFSLKIFLSDSHDFWSLCHGSIYLKLQAKIIKDPPSFYIDLWTFIFICFSAVFRVKVQRCKRAHPITHSNAVYEVRLKTNVSISSHSSNIVTQRFSTNQRPSQCHTFSVCVEREGEVLGRVKWWPVFQRLFLQQTKLDLDACLSVGSQICGCGVKEELLTPVVIILIRILKAPE